MLCLERDAWSTVKGLRQATNEPVSVVMPPLTTAAVRPMPPSRVMVAVGRPIAAE